MATRTANTGSNNWNTNGAWVGGVQPTAADDVIIPSGATVNIPTATNVFGRSLEVQSGGVLSFATTSATLNLGDGTAGSGNSIINISSGSTITLTGIGVINLLTTSTTVQTITTGGKTVPTLTFNGSGQKIQFADSYTSTGNINLTQFDTVDFNSQNISCSVFNITSNSNTRSITWGTSVVNATLFGGTPINASLATNVTVTASVGAQLNASNGNNPTINLGSIDYGNVAVSHSSASAMTATLASSGATVYSYTRSGAASKIEFVNLYGTGITITNSLNVNGNSAANRIYMRSASTGVSFAIVNNGTNNLSNIDIADIAASGSASWNLSAITGLSGDCGGNTGITFTTAINCYWVAQGGTSTGNWSNSNKWASSSGGTGGTARVPLAQDNVFIDANSVDAGSRTITIDMARVGKNVNFTGVTNTPTIAWTTSINQSFYGDVTFVSGINFSFTNTVNWVLAGRGNHTFTTGGKVFLGTNMSPTVDAGSGSYTCQDAFTLSHGFSITSGSFYTNGYTMTWATFTSSTTLTRALYLGSSIVNLTNTTGTIWNVGSTGLTISASSSQIIISTTSASTRTFSGGGHIYNILDYTLSGSTGQLTLSTSTFIAQLKFSDASNARTLAATVGQTITFDDISGIQGTASKLMSVVSSVSGSPAYIEVIGQPSVTDYLSIKDIYSVIPNKFYAGTNSTNVSGNTNIEFTASPATLYIRLRGDYSGGVITGTPVPVTFAYNFSPASGRRIIAAVSTNNDAAVITPPSGFSLITNVTQSGLALAIFEKIADGTESSLSFTSDTTASVFQIKLYVLGGFTGTPTVDVYDYNANTSTTTSSSTAGTAPSNTANPALAIAFFNGNGTMGNSVSGSNGFGVLRDSVEQTVLRALNKYLTSNASVSTTYTWTTSRKSNAALVVYKDVVAVYQPRYGFIDHANPGVF